jgi:hypothetical protein
MSDRHRTGDVVRSVPGLRPNQRSCRRDSSAALGSDRCTCGDTWVADARTRETRHEYSNWPFLRHARAAGRLRMKTYPMDDLVIRARLRARRIASRGHSVRRARGDAYPLRARPWSPPSAPSPDPRGPETSTIGGWGSSGAMPAVQRRLSDRRVRPISIAVASNPRCARRHIVHRPWRRPTKENLGRVGGRLHAR